MIFVSLVSQFLALFSLSLTAMKHRKLFPTLAATNQSGDCSGFCDPACPDNCYPYSDYSFQPPPPPSLPPPPTLLPQEHHISPHVIVIVSLLGGFFLLVSYYVIIAKSCPGWLCWRSNRQPEAQVDNTDQEFLDENRVEHPIWFITTTGLQQSIINSITVCKYKKGEGLIDGTECSVCLSEFRQDETLRLLPKCSHAFHISCIDTWLRSHTNCPLCRAHIVSDAVSFPMVSVNQSPDNSNTNVSTQIENTEIHDEFGNSQDRNEICENRTGAGAEVGAERLLVGAERIAKDDVNSNDNEDIEIVDDTADNYQHVLNGIQPMKRSFSMDSLTAATMCLGMIDHCPPESEGSSINPIKATETTTSNTVLDQNDGCSSSLRPMGRSSIAQCLHKCPVPMKRSFSCAGRFFSSRQNRSLNSILPL